MNELTQHLPTASVPVANGHHKEAAQQIATAADVARLEAELLRYRTENTQLRKRLRYSAYHIRLADQARADAMLFVIDLLADKDVSQAAMNARHGISRRRWENLRAALQAADIADSYGRLRSINARAIHAALRRLVEQIEEEGNADRIFRHLPRWRRQEHWRPR